MKWVLVSSYENLTRPSLPSYNRMQRYNHLRNAEGLKKLTEEVVVSRELVSYMPGDTTEDTKAHRSTEHSPTERLCGSVDLLWFRGVIGGL